MNSVPLTQAVTSGDAGVVKALLANGADVNEPTGGGQTPLILATIFGHTHLISLLLDAGADPQLRDNLGLNAIDWAQRRGATEAIAVLSNKDYSTAKSRSDVRSEPPPQRSPQSHRVPEVEKPAAVSEAERSRRWIAGLKQRIAEQSAREVPDGPNIFRAQPSPNEPPPWLASPEPETQLPESRSETPEREPQPEIPAEPAPQPEIPAQPKPEPEMPAQPPDPQPEMPAPPPAEEPQTQSVATASAPEVTRRSSGRKRCPKCNAVYNSDLVAYCAHHFVALVDDDESSPIISEPPHTTSPVLFWMIIVITLTGSIVVGSIVAAFFYTSKQVQPAVTATQPPPSGIQKGTPVVGKELEGKELILPIAECPLNGQEAIPGTVVVRVTIDRTGQVTEARASGGDWLLRGAASEAAMKSTFAPDKLRGRETEGTITYTFEP